MKKTIKNKKGFKYYKRVIIEKNEIIHQEIVKTFIVKKKESQFAKKIIDEIEYIIFESKTNKEKINYNLIARNTKSKDLKFYFLNSITRYDVILELEKVVKISEFNDKNLFFLINTKIENEYLKIFLDIFLERIENSKEKFLNYVKNNFFEKH